ncbi:MAG TPA: endolytic transglycosylase MltG [Bacteroidia bacterium]|nr:endolytic transglycosylase MltG [Bacteroidia bacterium]
MNANPRNIWKRIFTFMVIILIVFASAGGFWFYRIYFNPSVQTPDKKQDFLYIRTGTTMPELMQQMADEKIISDTSGFMVIAKLKKFTVPKPGRYRIKDGMNNRELVNLLRAGLQEKVSFTLNQIRTKEELAGRVGAKLEADSAQVIFLLNDAGYLSRYGMIPSTVMTLFIPDTYFFYWNTSAEQWFERMTQEYKKFWTEARKAKARNMNLTQSEVVILASIVESEQFRYPEERPLIAGLYLNRLKKNIRLQSDPTVIYALGDFSIQRVSNADLEVDSPYNTYKYAGLPPGPIRIPQQSSIDAVLNYQECDFIYMCADFETGKHKFSKEYDEHLKYAREYQKALNKAEIKR